MNEYESELSRRTALKALAAVLGGSLAGSECRSAGAGGFNLSTFTADVTPPVGNPLYNGSPETARAIVDPLHACGLVLRGLSKPVVLVAVDWCEIRNESYERWRSVLAQAAKTDKEKVLVSCVHQHDAPYSDFVAQ